MEKIALTRKELYDLVWGEPLYSLAERMQIATSELIKTCEAMNIPIPNEHHWLNKLFGHRNEQPRLPEEFEGGYEISLPIKSKKSFFEAFKTIKTQVPNKLTNPDLLIISAKKSLENRKETIYNGLISTARGELSISVSPENVDRALRFIDTLIKILRSRNHKIEITSSNSNVIVYGISMEFSLREKLSRQKSLDKWMSTTYSPTGLFVFKIGKLHPYEWIDTSVKLEDKLNDIVKGLEFRAIMENDWVRVCAEHKQKELNAKELAEKKRQVVEKEIIKFKQLISAANQLHQTNILRAYIKEFEEIAGVNGTLNEESIEWIEWAKEKIDWFNPFSNKKDSILDENERQKILEELMFNKKPSTQIIYY